MPEIMLTGCRPTPLVGYLKALGVFRLVASQIDSHVKGFWRDDVFVLVGELDGDGLARFLVEDYAPTPIVAPWNGGSGFYDGDATDGIDAITSTNDPRFADYQQIIDDIRDWPEMPRRFETVLDLVEKLKQAAREASGKKLTNLEKQIDAIESGWTESMDALDGIPTDGPLDAIESAVKKLKGRGKKVVTDWWKMVRKARTTCNQLERGSGKEGLLSVCRSRLPESSLAWFDSAIALRADGTPAFSPLLGSGGNEGRLDFSNNFMQRIADLLINGEKSTTTELLHTSLFVEPRCGLVGAKIGQFDPGRAGGYNQGAGIEAKDFKINPWDFVLTLEGATALASSVGRKSLSGSRGLASIPFTVGFSGVGFASSEHTESGKAETWLPVWPSPATFGEVRYLFGEGRSTIGRRMVRTGLDFTRAVGSLGVDRGVDGFVRYAFMKRRGDSYVALPAGRLSVRFQPSLRLLDDIDPILDRIDGSLHQFKNVPATFESAKRRIDEALYECCVESRAERFADVVCALGQMEYLVAQRDRSKKPALSSPLRGLRPQWITECDDGGPEVRIAAALSSIRSTGNVGPIRANMAGVDASEPWKWAAGHGQRRWHGSDLVERLAGVLAQRIIDAERLSAPRVPVEGSLRLSPRDLVPFLYGETDDQRLEELLWGFTLVEWWGEGRDKLGYKWHAPLASSPLPRGWCAMKLVCSPERILGQRIRREPRIVGLLKAGRADEAVGIAHHRFKVSDLKPLPVAADEWIDSVRQLAALLVPTRDQELLVSLVLEKRQTGEG